MSLKERLADFVGAITSAVDAPDNYPFPEFQSYEANMADIKELWAEIRPQIKRDLVQAEFVDAKLQEMFTAFEAGEKEKGRDAAWAIYNSKAGRLR